MAMTSKRAFVTAACFCALAACGTHRTYHNPGMDFGSVKTVAVLPFQKDRKSTRLNSSH